MMSKLTYNYGSKFKDMLTVKNNYNPSFVGQGKKINSEGMTRVSYSVLSVFHLGRRKMEM